MFESGNQIFQLTAGAAWLSPARERWRVELSGVTGASRYADEAASAHALARSRIHFFAKDRGAWFGAGTGASVSDDARVPLELALGAWRVRERFMVVGTITGVSLGDDRHLDIAGAARWTLNRIELDAVLGARLFASSDEALGDARVSAWGELSAAVPLTERIGLTVSGGSSRSDPVRRALGSTYMTAGLQLALAGPRGPPAPVMPALTHARVNADGANRARLEIAPAGRLHTLRIFAAGAKSVEVMGDFTDWQPLALTAVGEDGWQIQLQLAAGVHRLNVRIDGGAWFVPGGARPEQDEFGSVVGIVVID